MWSSRLFWKLFLAYVVLNVLSAAAFGIIVSRRQQEQVTEHAKRRLHDSAVILRDDVRDLLAGGRTESLQERVRQLGQRTGTRITLVDMDGLVLADSEQPGLAQVARMDNHKDRVELSSARDREEGSSERRSPTLGVPMLYYAVRADVDGRPVGFVRLAMPMKNIHEEVAVIERLAWLVALLVLFAVGVVTYWVVARIIRPVANLTQAAEAMARGEYQQQIYVNARDELQTLAKSFNRMSREMSRREAELRENSERMATVLGGMSEGVIAVDDNERVLIANKAATVMLGFLPERAVGRPLLEVVRKHILHEAAVKSLAGRDAGNREIEFEVTEQRVLAVTATRLPGDPCPGVVLVLRNVTDIRRLESLRQEFVANVSHELKTPLSSIKAYTETLRGGETADDEVRKKFLSRIEEQADRLHELILDLLSLARIEAGRRAFEIEPVCVSRAVEECLASHRAAAAAKNIEMITGNDGELSVEADAEGLRQILSNLIDNAIKYTPEGGRVRVDWRAVDGVAVVEVNDTGIGIAPQHHARLFERFYRVDKARSRELGGTGLGLAIVKHLTQSFGGSVSVTSAPGAGSTFSIRLPRA